LWRRERVLVLGVVGRGLARARAMGLRRRKSVSREILGTVVNILNRVWRVVL
jgi:hypothetical protein